MDRSFSGCEIVELGVQIENSGRDFFGDMAEKAKDAGARKVFARLAEEDARHAEVFRKIFDSKCVYKPQGAYPEEYFAYMKALVGDYVSAGKDMARDMEKAAADERSALDAGIRYVKDAILFYESVKALVAGKDRSTIDELIREEKSHLARLGELKSHVA